MYAPFFEKKKGGFFFLVNLFKVMCRFVGVLLDSIGFCKSLNSFKK
jgi:hypothetical protein